MKLVLGPPELSTELDFIIPTTTWNKSKVNRVGVYVSGGHDSAALLCLVLSELRATNRLDTVQVTAFTIIKDEGSTYYAQRIVDKVSNHFNVPVLHVNNIANGKDAYAAGRIGGPAIKQLWIENFNDMILYMAVNRMAPDDIRPFDQKLNIVYKENMFFRSPFLLLHKPQILDIYYKLGCEDIIQYTHSCTVKANGFCNNCYSCKEREWGFTALNKEIINTVEPDIEDISFGGTWEYTKVSMAHGVQ